MFGGLLTYLNARQDRTIFRIPPRFNTVLILNPKNLLHTVTPVKDAAGASSRYTVTVFYLDREQSVPGSRADSVMQSQVESKTTKSIMP